MGLFDDVCIQALPRLSGALKGLMLQMKYGRPPELMPTANDIILHYDNTIVTKVSWMYCVLNFLTEENGLLRLEGCVNISGFPMDEPVSVALEVNGTEYPCAPVDRSAAAQTRLGLVLQQPTGFAGTLDPGLLPDPATVHVVCKIRGYSVRMSSPECGRMMPVSSWLQ